MRVFSTPLPRSTQKRITREVATQINCHPCLTGEEHAHVLNIYLTIADYQELNMEHRSLSSNTSLVRSWSPFTGFLKMYLSFHETLTLYLADVPSIMASTFYQFVIDTRRKELGVYKVTDGVRVEMVNQSFSAQFHEQKRLFVVNRNETHWIIGGNGLPQAIEDSSKDQMKYWGIACSSLNPVKLTFWKHIGS